MYDTFMNLIILNGPTGTGKNTISSFVAKNRQHCAVIDFDVLRNMFANPHRAPWQGEEGHSQQILGVDHACSIAKSFLDHNFDVILLDVLSDETATLYKEKLHHYKPHLVLLLPTFEEIIQRNLSRPPRLTHEELKMVYEQQTQLHIFDTKIDNSLLSAEEVANQILQRMT